MTRSIGRPLKYQHILERLENDEIYSPAAISRFALERGLIDGSTSEERTAARHRVRIAMARLSNYHGFPDEGDALISLPRHRPMPAWYGWRWKLVMEGNYESARQPT